MTMYVCMYVSNIFEWIIHTCVGVGEIIPEEVIVGVTSARGDDDDNVCMGTAAVSIYSSFSRGLFRLGFVGL
jgi:hypothetical protein